LDLILETINRGEKDPNSFPLFKIGDIKRYDEEKVIQDKEKNVSSLQKLRKLYPNRPEYKAMNEE
jgi:hypothetical protein